MCLLANHFDVIVLGVKVDQGLPCICHYIPQVEWQATLRTPDGTQTLVVSRLSKPDSRGASEGDLVLLGSNSDRWDLVKDQVVGGIA